LPQNLTTTVIRSRSEMDAIASAWLALQDDAPHDTLFQSAGWTRAVWDFQDKIANPDFDPVIVLAYDGEKLIAVLPLEGIRTSARKLLVPMGYVFTQISNVLLLNGYDAKPVVAAMIKEAHSAAACDVILFNKVRQTSCLAQGMPDNHVLTGEELGAPVVELSEFPSYAAYFQTIRAKTRKNIRNARNRLERQAPLRHDVIDTPDALRTLVARTLKGRADRLREQGLTSRAFANSHFSEFCDSLVDRVDLPLSGFSLVHGENPIAEQWGFVHRGRYYAFIATRDFSHSDESPGKMHLAEITKTCSDRELDACDLGIPVMPYKLTWATRTETVRDYAIPLTARGKTIVSVWDVFLRPKLKFMVMHTPVGIRSVLMRMIGRQRVKKLPICRA
jgi:CelD/BcsL family acetyltransferase involved in cellulose biosynthesis